LNFFCRITSPATGTTFGVPLVANASPSGTFTLSIAFDVPGDAYYVVVDGGASEPTRARVVAGTDAAGATPLAAGVVSAPTANALASANVSLGAGQSVSSASAGYDVFVAVVASSAGGDVAFSGDGAAPGNVARTNAAKVAPGLVPDAAAVAAGETPAKGADCVGVNATGETSITPQFSLSAVPAKVAYVLLKHGAKAPSPAQILAGVDAHGASPGGGGSDFPDTRSSSTAGHGDVLTAFTPTAIGGGIVNLTKGVLYDVYAVAVHAAAATTTGPDGVSTPYANAPPRAVSRTIRTLDNTPPFFLPGHPRVAAVVPTGTTLEVRVDETAAVWVVVVPFGSVATPTSADVAAVAAAAAGATSGVAHVAATATSPALASARASSALGDTESKRSGAGDDVLPLVLTLTGLSPSTRYDAYVVARDFVGREEVGSGGVDAVNLLQDLPTKIAIVTPDAAAWLESLTPSVGTLEPRFDPSAGSYRLLLPDPALPGVAAPSVSFVAAVANEDWVVTVDGVEAMPGVASAPVLVGADAVEVIVRVAPRADALPPGAAAAAAAETPATYKIAAMRSSVAAAARAADATLALLHVALDTGDSFNATDLGGESWPGCHRACRPPGTSPPCASSCALDPSQRRYRLVAPTSADVATITTVTTSPGATVRVFDGPPEVVLGVASAAASGAVAAAADAAGASPGATAAAASLRRVELNAPSLGAAALYVRVTSADGTRVAYYVVAVRRTGPGAYERGGVGGGVDSVGGNRADADRGLASRTAPNERRRPVGHASAPPLTFYPR